MKFDSRVKDSLGTSVSDLRIAAVSLYLRSSLLYSLLSAAARPTMSRVTVSKESIFVDEVN